MTLTNEQAQRVWEAARAHLQVQMSSQDFNTWLRDAVLVGYEDGTFIIGVPNAFIREWLRTRLHRDIKHTVEQLAGRSVDIVYTVHVSAPSERPNNGPLMEIAGQNAIVAGGTTLNPRYTFERYIVGESNLFAHRAAMAVATRPGEAYNPLFIYGGVGLGKTHLLHAIGHRAAAQGYRVLYVSSETFTNDLIHAIRSKTTDKFRNRYRNVDVLLIDDVQFIAGKESTQEEFFHTFNALHSANKQICLTSDRPPREIATLEERLRSRFQGGMIVNIHPPDFQTRLAILRSWTQERKVRLADEVLEYIAEQITTNIRELNGAFNRVVAQAELLGATVTLAHIRELLVDMLPREAPLTPEGILQAVAVYFRVRVEDLCGKSRKRTVAWPRQVAMYLLRQETDLSLPQIGQWIGGRDHTTVLHGCEKVAKELDRNPQLQRQLEEIRSLAERYSANGIRLKEVIPS